VTGTKNDAPDGAILAISHFLSMSYGLDPKTGSSGCYRLVGLLRLFVAEVSQRRSGVDVVGP
jgi:hypothetical protein